MVPDGPCGKSGLMLEHYHAEIEVLGDYAAGSVVCFDWYNDRLQILIYAADDDEPVVTVCLNKDGTVAVDQDAWRKERDASNHEQT